MGKRLGGDTLETYEKKGYLLRDFRVFHLLDQRLSPIPFHYHDFHKIILFLGGHADYIIEGRSYPLVPRDIIFVSAGEIHRPVLSPDVPYERIVIYVAPAFLARCQKDGDDLAACFQKARVGSSVMHAGTGLSHDLLFHMEKLEHTSREEGFANGLYTEILFIEFMILLNRAMLAHELGELHASSYDEKIQQVLAYINSHLDTDLTIDALAEHVYLSKYYLMRKFKQETGYSIHQYITSKRLLAARKMLSGDEPVTDICYACGFHDYSTFSRAFHAMFHMTPKEWRAQVNSVSSLPSLPR